jgi:hypothetical protein
MVLPLSYVSCKEQQDHKTKIKTDIVNRQDQIAEEKKVSNEIAGKLKMKI